jgi:uncharacterized protein YjbJ (UPF0337 family)
MPVTPERRSGSFHLILIPPEPFRLLAVFLSDGHDASDRVRIFGRPRMGSTSDKISGAANKTAGKAKQAAGEVTGSEKLRAEGKGQEIKGKVQTASGKAKSAVKGAVDRM